MIIRSRLVGTAAVNIGHIIAIVTTFLVRHMGDHTVLDTMIPVAVVSSDLVAVLAEISFVVATLSHAGVDSVTAVVFAGHKTALLSLTIVRALGAGV